MNRIDFNYTGAATGTPGDSTSTIDSSGGTNIDITDIMSNADFYTNTSGDNIKVSINNTDALIIAADGTIYHPATGTTELVIPDGVSVLTGTLLIDPNSSSYETWIPIIIPDESGMLNSLPPVYSLMVDSGNLPSELTHESLIGNWDAVNSYNNTSYFTKVNNDSTFYLYNLPDPADESQSQWVINTTLGLSANHIAVGPRNTDDPKSGNFLDIQGVPFKFLNGPHP